MYAIALDIGTTTICAIVIDTRSGEVIRTTTDQNDTWLNGQPFERLQNAVLIRERAEKLISSLVQEFFPVSCIGVTGQMHGIVYLDRDGNAVSPLYTWQDESANQPFKDGKTYAQILSQETGYAVSSGYGVATLFYHHCNEMIPTGAASVCTIQDFIAMKLAGQTRPVLHVSDAASLGCFCAESNSFDKNALSAVGLPLDLLPEIGGDYTVLGLYQGKIPVSLAIGDNQASYFGSVCNLQDCILVNIGTGSQISFPAAPFSELLPTGLERRPCGHDTAILVGSSLCGGRAFAALERFFRETAEMVTGRSCPSAYPGMDRLLANSPLETSLAVSTKLGGTRLDPQERGSIRNLGLDNFTPRDFMLGVLQGIVEELYEMYRSAGLQSGCKNLIGSGNGLRQNVTLRRLFEKAFGLPLKIPEHREEAAFGAALYALVVTGAYSSIEEAQTLIRYQ